MTIDKNKTYRTRAGSEVRIYATDGRGEYPIHGAYKEVDGWRSTNWQETGEWEALMGSVMDLIEVKPRIQREVWLSVYPNVTMINGSKEGADTHRGDECLACVKVTIDCEEGEGME